MALTNYWWLLLWIFIAGAFSLLVKPQQEELVLGRRVWRWRKLPAFLLALPYVLWAGFRTEVFGDTASYRAMFRAVPDTLSGLRPFVQSQVKDKGFAVLEVLFKCFVSHSDTVFFLVIAAVQMLCLVLVFRKYSRSYWFSMFLFVASADYLSWMHNGVRQFIAVALLFACLPLIAERKQWLVVLVVLAASLIHASALLFLPFLFIIQGEPWNPRTVLFLAAVLVAVYFLDEFSDLLVNIMEETQYAGEVDQFVNDDGTNILRVLFYSVPALMTLLFRARIAAAGDRMINICANLSIVAAGFYIISYFTSGLLMGRVPIYFSLANYILIPWLLSELFTPDSALLLQALFVGVYSFFFYYQTGVTWGLL